MTKTWISVQEALRALVREALPRTSSGKIGITPRWLRALIKRGKITARTSAKGRRREILLESLPLSAQEKYLQSANTQQNENATRAPIAVQSLDAVPADKREQLLEYGEDLRAIPSGAGRGRAIRAAARKWKLSRQTIRNDLKNLDAHGFAGILRQERSDRGVSRVADNEVIARIKKMYLKPHRPRIAQVHRAIEKDYEMNGKEAPSYSSVRRVAQSIDPVLVARYRIGEKYAEDNFEPIILRKRPRVPRDLIDFDHHPFDHLIRFPNGRVGRPWITMAQDRCTSEIYALYVTPEKTVGEGSYPGADAICLALRQGLLKKNDPQWPTHGLFDRLMADLGRDFRSEQVRQACLDLGINIVHTRGYHGRSKPIERTFGVLENDLRHLPGYSGSKPDENPERQSIQPKPIDPAKLLSFEEATAELLKWVKDYGHRKSLALNRLSPFETLAIHVQNGFTVREVQNEPALNLILMRHARRTVRNVGIQMFSTPEQPRYFSASETWPLIGQTVDVRWDPATIGEIFVFKGDKFICRAENRELLEFRDSEETLERARAIRRDHNKRTKERMQEILTRAQYKDPEARARAEQRYDKFVSEERAKIAAGAQAQGVPVLLPKFAKAAKKLRSVPRNAPAKLERPVESSLDLAEPITACHQCGVSAKSRRSCLDCFIKEGEDGCEKCGGIGGHQYCGDCAEEHAHHTNPGACDGCGVIANSSPLRACFNCVVEYRKTCPGCRGVGAHRYCRACLDAHSHKRDRPAAEAVPT